MNVKFLPVLLLFLSLCYLNKSDAAHIIGGVMYYEYISTQNNVNTYKITMKVYRDCSGSGAALDNLAFLSVGRSDFTYFIKEIKSPREATNNLSNQFSNFCLTLPPNVCVQEGIYTETINLPIDPTHSYYIIYQRCCRNNTVFNIMTPGDIGASFMVEITPLAQQLKNSSPQFINFPPIAICGGYAINFDHSALDVDGDSLVYQFTSPFVGGGKANDNSCFSLTPMPPCLPPYEPVTYRPPFKESDPMGGSPSLNLDRATGLLTGKPDILGQFVVGVRVREYRNGNLLSTVYRDFQFNVAQCEKTVNALLEINEEEGKDLEIKLCGGNSQEIRNISTKATSILTYSWEFENAGIVSTSNEKNITLSTVNEGIYNGTLILNDGLECTDTAHFKLYKFPGIKAGFDFAFDPCDDAGVSFVNNSSSEANLMYSNNWSANGTDFSTSSDPLWPDIGQGLNEVTLTVNDINNCRDSFTLSINFETAPQHTLSFFPEITGCVNTPVEINSLLPAEVNAYELEWDFGDGSKVNTDKPVHIYSVAGDYDISVKAIHRLGCIYEADFANVVHIKPAPEAGFDYQPHELSNFSAQIEVSDESKGGVKWIYDFGNGDVSSDREPIYTYPDTGFYLLKQSVFNTFGCRDSIVYMVDVKPLYTIFLPNAFLPGSSGTNDSFGPVGIPFGMKEYEMIIFDRWGNKVFESKDFNDKWDGRDLKGRELTNGLYAVRVLITGPRGGKESIEGQALLIK